MQAKFARPRSDVFLVVGIVCVAGLLAALAALLVYIAIQNYDPALSCEELEADAFTSGAPPDIDTRDDWELLCSYY